MSAGLVVPAAPAAGRSMSEPRRPPQGVVEIGDRKQLFLDERLFAWKSRVSTYMGHPRRHPRNPLILPDRPWEKGRPVDSSADGVQISGQSVIYDLDEKLFKMWYHPYTLLDSGNRPWCYATSRDGVSWEKPDLGIFDNGGSRANNILAANRRSKYFNVFKDPQDSDPARRYKAMGELEGRGASGAAVAFSPDGLRWTEYPGNPVAPKGREITDSPTLLGWDSRIRKYVYYPRPGFPLAPRINGTGFYRPPQGLNPNVGQLRSIGYSTSDDFVRWSPTQLMQAPDELDRADWQYYQMTAAQEGEYYIGLMHMMQTHDQTFDIYLLTSVDGFHWDWVDRRLPFLKRGDIGSYDAGYLMPSGPIVHDGTIWIYYGACTGAHSYETNRLGPNHMTIALATLPADRYVGMLAGPDLAFLVTRPLIFSGSKLMMDLDASLPDRASKRPTEREFDEADVRVAVLDQWGGKIDGFEVERCRMIAESGVQEVSWENATLGALEGKPVRLRFEYRNAALYSLQFS
jgi:hypothetical protein